MTHFTVQIPSAIAKMVNEDREITPPWYRLLEALWKRTGTGGGLQFIAAELDLAGGVGQFDPIPSGLIWVDLYVADLKLDTDNIDVELQVKVNGTWQNANYEGVSITGDSAAGLAAAAGSTTGVRVASGLGNAAGRQLSFSARIWNASDTTVTKKISFDSFYTNAAGNRVSRPGAWGRYTASPAAITGVRMAYSGGAVATGGHVSLLGFNA